MKKKRKWLKILIEALRSVPPIRSPKIMPYDNDTMDWHIGGGKN